MEAWTSASSDTEQEASKAIAAGDHRAALTILMDDYGGDIYRYCCSLIRDVELATDVHQITFVNAFESMSRFKGTSTLRTWLYGIARHRCLDALRSRARRDKRFVLTDKPPERASASDSEERLATRALTHALSRCLHELAPRIRNAIVLRFVEGLSYGEMASICRARPATLQARVTRALPVLRQCLESSGATL